ncbi:hypothetical protein DL766_003648 [Monosporascus sp. MC13-8B]|uniref:Uncharacterized protein n=1 Tax=Monosporascus cannonballus TaxID=155416 RepID=A0ABY0H6Y0_9PEZI|nr:hypothetical protein DL762_004933 [Monosporascus cannonballus]RYO91571.1 hypothetical protein DL763_004952 [Monosporascus cannonballus]RYP33148.1 hypothetical protein DL766_003648 [Monosporascus sp. MC13-8B]
MPVVLVVVGIAVFFISIIVVFSVVRRKDKGKLKKGKYKQTSGFESSTRHLETPRNFDAAVSEVQGNNSNASGQINREPSVRSVLTLPAYRHNPDDNEQVLGREGERDGVDVVVEYPTPEEQEAMREEEMATLYEVRVARQQQIAERAEQRRLRDEARRRGDSVALRELRAQERSTSRSSAVNDLREAHEQAKERRQRAVSSVSYHDLGVARHDGTRIRANSTESERIGLLSDAASITPSTRPASSMHQRERSASSVLSFDSDAGGMPSSPGFPSMSGATTPRLSNYSHTRAGSSPEIINEADLGAVAMPPSQSPPDYEEISLEDARSRAATPAINEPPPNYPGPSPEWGRRSSAHGADLVDRSGEDGDLSTLAGSSDRRNSARPTSRGVGGVPQLPSLRLGSVPQIVIETEDLSSYERR